MVTLPNEPAPFAAFIARHLLQPLDPGPGAARAVAETEHPFTGDRWFWADDNAKALELLTLPALWRSHGDAARESFRFLASLCRGPFIFRRTAHPRLEVRHRDGLVAGFTHAFLSIEADLPRGSVGVGMRFHDGRDTESLRLAAHRLRFTAGGTTQEVTPAISMSGGDIRLEGGLLVLEHHAEIERRSWGRTRRIGRFTVTHRFRAESGAFDVEAALDVDPGAEVSDVTITLAGDRLSHGVNGVRYDTLHGMRSDGDTFSAIAPRGEAAVPGTAGAAYWCLAQNAAMRGFALGIHAQPRDPRQVAALRLLGDEGGAVQWIGAEHAFPGRHSGGRLVAAERHVLTSGGFYDAPVEYASLLADAGLVASGRPTDISISYDYGAELVAFSRTVRLLSSPVAQDPPMRGEATALYDALLATYLDRFLEVESRRPGAVFSRPLAFVVQSLCDMASATGDPRYRATLETAVEALLGYAREQADIAGGPSMVFVMSAADPTPYMDCHAAALLALARAVPLLAGTPLHGRAVAAVDCGLHAFSLATVAVEFEGRKRQDVVAVDFTTPEGRRQLDGFWNFGVGLALRAFRVVQRSPDEGLRAVAARHEERLILLRSVMLLQLRRSVRDRDGAVEVRTSVLSGETNSETQPWVALALARQSGDS